MNIHCNSIACWARFSFLDRLSAGADCHLGAIFGLVLALSSTGCDFLSGGRVALTEFTGETMGTTYSVKVVAEKLRAAPLKKAVDDRLAALNQTFSTYIPDSEMSRLNRQSGSLAISEELARVMSISRDIFELSGGALDVTVGPLVNLWGFGPAGPRKGVPSIEEISEALSRTGFGKVNFSSGRLHKPPGLVIDLSAVAKGYAVDAIAELIERAGGSRYLVEIGGEVRARGLNGRGKSWVIGIEAPEREARLLYSSIPVRDLGMATSGDYRNFFAHQGRYYSHALDPATGWPVAHRLASVTVLHASAAYADGLATAFQVLGPDRTMKIAEANNFKVFAIIRDQGTYKTITSSAMKTYLEKLPP